MTELIKPFNDPYIMHLLYDPFLSDNLGNFPIDALTYFRKDIGNFSDGKIKLNN